MVASTIAGGVGGIVSGSGMNSKGLKAAWDSAQDGILREGRRANLKYAAKQIAKYTAKKSIVKDAVKIGLSRFTGGVLTYSTLMGIWGY